MTTVVLSPAAERDLEDIWLTIAKENLPAADRLLAALGRKIERLARHPRLGSRRPDIRPSVRMLVEGPYLLLYEIQPDSDAGEVVTVEIVRALDGRRDLARQI